MTDELSALRDENFKLKCALYDIISMERTVTPDMGGKRRTFAYMRNGQVLAEIIDRGWELLGYDWSPTDPAHGGKIMKTGPSETLSACDVVLLKNQPEPSADGVYIVGGDPDDYRDPFAIRQK